MSSQESIDTAAATARVAGLSGIIEIVPPAEKGAAWTVTDMREEWKLSNDAIAVDGETGEIVDRVDHADWPLAAKLSAWLIQLHMGTLFGWINQLVLGVIALGLLVVILLGYRVWWKRRRFLAAAQWRRTRPGLLALHNRVPAGVQCHGANVRNQPRGILGTRCSDQKCGYPEI